MSPELRAVVPCVQYAGLLKARRPLDPITKGKKRQVRDRETEKKGGRERERREEENNQLSVFSPSIH